MHSTQAETIGGQKEEASDGYTPTTTSKRQPSMSLTDKTGNPKRKRGTDLCDDCQHSPSLTRRVTKSTHEIET